MKKTLLWIAAIIITVAGAWYTRTTGPTKPVKDSIELNGETITYSLIRTYAKDSDAPVKVAVNDQSITGTFIYKRTPSHDNWTHANMVRDGEHLVANLPQQPPAGKIMYQITLHSGGESVTLTDNPIVIRFRGDVPAMVMIPHILLMFLAMLWSTRAGLAALFNDKTKAMTITTSLLLLGGGLIFGPLVQKFAFGAYWTGWPFGTDLTDNKTAFAFLMWLIASWQVWRNPKYRTWVIVASVVLLLIYMIPHSMMGSEIDYTQVPGE